MTNPFIEQNDTDFTDQALVESAVKGDKKSLEQLVKRHQAWIYNIALKMVWDPADAEDVTQETLIKIIFRHVFDEQCVVDTCVVDQNIDISELFGNFRKEIFAICFGRDVAFKSCSF